MTSGELRECLFLVNQGVPFDVSFGLDDLKRTGWAIIFSELNGAKFNWKTMRFEDDK